MLQQLPNGQVVDLPYLIGTPIQPPFGAPQQGVPFILQGQQQTTAYGANNAPKMNTNIIRVYGIDGARNYQLPPNSDMILFDNDQDIIYRVSVDGTGKREVFVMDLSEHKEEPPVNFSAFATKDDIAKLRKEVATIREHYSADRLED